jgi:hypothetical protein
MTVGELIQKLSQVEDLNMPVMMLWENRVSVLNVEILAVEIENGAVQLINEED